MVQIVVTGVFALLAGVLGGSAFAEWLRRRSPEERLKADAEVLRSLPDDSEAHAALLRQMQQRIEQQGTGRSGWAVARRWRWVITIGALLLFNAFVWTVFAINYGAYFSRDSSGTLRVFGPQGQTPVTFQMVVYGVIVLMVGGLMIGQALTKLLDKWFP